MADYLAFWQPATLAWRETRVELERRL